MKTETSIRYRINLTVIITLLTIGLIFGAILFVYEQTRRDGTIDKIESYLIELTRARSESLGNEMFSRQTLALRMSLQQVINHENLDDKAEILGITAFAPDGEVLSAVGESSQNTPFDNRSGLDITMTSIHLETINGHPVVCFFSPIVAYGEFVGFWRIDYSIALLEQQIINTMFIYVMAIVTFSIMLFWLLNHLLLRLILRPLDVLQATMNIMKSSDGKASLALKEQQINKMLNSFERLPSYIRPNRKTNNEINALAYSFHAMLNTLKDNYVGLRRDNLTGLANRACLDEAISKHMDLNKRYQQPFSILLLDVDHFKKVNDQYGHLVGDEVLKALSQYLNLNVRKSDVVGRWGGEEFLIILPRQSRQGAFDVAEKLRKHVEQRDMILNLTITISIGVAEYQTSENQSDLIKRADIALYRAKEQGRNQVQVGE